MIESCEKGQTIYCVVGNGMSTLASVDNGDAVRKRVKLEVGDTVQLYPLMLHRAVQDCYASRLDAQAEADRRNLAGSVYRAKESAGHWQADVAETMARAEDALRTALRRARAAGVRVDVSRIRAMIEEVERG